jgi:hypothetical protein
VDHVAVLARSERAALFGETAAVLGIRPVIAEKDFWVCWVLMRLFALSGDRPGMLFKGGTSLSKAYALIDRFSEDIDVSLDRAHLYGTDLQDPEKAPSGKEAQRRIEALTAAAATYVSARFLPDLTEAARTVLGDVEGGWDLDVDDADALTVNFRYPRSLEAADYDVFRYLRPVVRIEMGIRGDQQPANVIGIRSYAAERFPSFFTHPATDVRVLAAERTFWEKVTLLHAEHHRPAGTPTQENLSRHYYDVARLADSDVKEVAFGQLDLLRRVVKHKKLFFRSGWAHYETARPGTMRLVPPEALLDRLRRDYASMREMIFGEAPPFDSLIETVRTLETEINAL